MLQLSFNASAGTGSSTYNGARGNVLSTDFSTNLVSNGEDHYFVGLQAPMLLFGHATHNGSSAIEDSIPLCVQSNRYRDRYCCEAVLYQHLTAPSWPSSSRDVREISSTSSWCSMKDLEIYLLLPTPPTSARHPGLQMMWIIS